VSSSGARRRQLLVSTNYAPEHAGIGPYATQIAEHWAADGAEVHVLTGMPHYPAWRLDPAYAGVKRVEEERSGVRVHRRAHAVPARQTAVKRVLFEVSVLRGGRDEPAGMERPDAVFAQMPSLAGGVLGARLAERHGVPFVPIVQDLMGAAAAQSGIRGGGLAAAAAGSVERYVLRRAALVGVIHESFVAKVAAMGVPEQRIRLVRNWSHVQSPSRPRDEMRARLGWRPGQAVLLHSGNMGLKQGLEVLVEAARLAPEVRVVLMGDGNQREQLRALAGGLPNLDFMPPAGDEEFADVLAAADVLVVTQRGSVRDMSLPSKLTSYFAAGRPVIAAVAADSGTAQEVANSGAGVVVPPESPGELLAAAAALLSDPARAAALASAGPAYAATHLTREAGLSRIDTLLTEALALAAASPDSPEPAVHAAPDPAAPPRPPEAPPVPLGEPAASSESAAPVAAPVPASAVPPVPDGEPVTSAESAAEAESEPVVPPRPAAEPKLAPLPPVAPPVPGVPPGGAAGAGELDAGSETGEREAPPRPAAPPGVPPRPAQAPSVPEVAPSASGELAAEAAPATPAPPAVPPAPVEAPAPTPAAEARRLVRRGLGGPSGSEGAPSGDGEPTAGEVVEGAGK
jgi:glycosyltransferase involved in cell wall biosynthesis